MKTIRVKNNWGRFDGEGYGHSKNELGQIIKDEKSTLVVTAYKVKWEE